ncbi:MAG: AtpZ/AtpI family protein [Cytophagales bacterium]|nr:AtpZ/AtpI family protein [Cytophagales bacterium]
MSQDHIPTGQKRPSNSYLRFGGFAFQLLGGIGLGAWVGHRLDLYLELKFPVFLLLFVLSILSGMLYQMYRKLNEN